MQSFRRGLATRGWMEYPAPKVLGGDADRCSSMQLLTEAALNYITRGSKPFLDQWGEAVNAVSDGAQNGLAE